MLYAARFRARRIIYKGMLACEQVLPFYADLTDPDYETHLAMVHSRFATNTFPTWDRAQPLRFLSHNGEINTLRGNKNCDAVAPGRRAERALRRRLAKAVSRRRAGLSDSGTLDNVLEFLLMNGRTLPEAVDDDDPRGLAEARDDAAGQARLLRVPLLPHGALGRPGLDRLHRRHVIGAVLDRNGLRPSRYYLTHDDRVIMAREVGVLPVPPRP